MNETRKWPAILFYLFLAALAAVGVGLGVIRLLNGMGPTTALSDNYPWGLWILYDIFFVPFSAGAFMILAVAHIYNRHEYHSLARPVVLAGFLGEVMVVAVLVMDLGRWHQFYNVLLPWNWNVRSFMFQISLCLTIYLGIMILEVAPAVLERFRVHKPLKLIRNLTVLIAAVGIVLSSLHQSALGSLFLLVPYKLDALWWTPLLPLMFFASAAFSGLAMAILVALLSFRALRRPLEMRLLADLAQMAAALLGLYLVLKIGDLLLSGELGLAFTQGWLSLLFVAEMVVGVVVPLILFGIPTIRASSRGLIWGAICVLAGLLLNRTSVALLGLHIPAEAMYVPHWMEIVISAAAVAGGVLLFALALRTLPIVPGDTRQPATVRGNLSLRGVMLALVGCTVLALVVVVGLQPIVRAEAAAGEMAVTVRRADPCRDCHVDPEALAQAGATADNQADLVIEPQPVPTPHGDLFCVTCHGGNGGTTDAQAAHVQVVLDPSIGNADACLACHADLPEELPEDRLRTPHDSVAHGQLVDVACSDCHGAVGHGFDPVSGEVICPMSVCLDCHQSRQLDSALSDCDACHMSGHEPVPAITCTRCHQSTEKWQEVETDDHPLELAGKHAQVQCLACHTQPNVNGECATCHEAPGESHYGPDCAQCHSTAGFQDARLPSHPVELEGAHQNVACAACHLEGQQTPDYVCSTCHERPEGHLAGECRLCHTPDGWTESAAFWRDLAPPISHALEGRQDCRMCHEPSGQIQPAPANHDAYTNEQCALCHKVAP